MPAQSKPLPEPLASQPFSRFTLLPKILGSGGQSKSGVWVCIPKVSRPTVASNPPPIDEASETTQRAARRNYEDYFELPRGTATLEQVRATSAGVAGWAGNNSEELAGKTLVWHKRNSRQNFEMVKREVNLLMKVSHPNIVRFVDYEILWTEVLETEKSALIVTELMENGDLMAFHEKTIKRKLVEKEVAPISYQILSGLRELHRLRIVHRDLKHGNILLADFQIINGSYIMKVKIADFGFSKKISDTAISTAPPLPSVRGGPASSTPSITGWFIGTNEYAAPEVFAVDDERDRARAAIVYKSPALDLWSLGVILYCLLKSEMVGEHLEFIFPGNTSRQFGTRTRICPALSTQHDVTTDVRNLEGCQQGFKDLIERKLQKKAEDRIAVDQALHGTTLLFPDALRDMASLFPELGDIPPRNIASASSSSSSSPPVNNVIASSSSSSTLSNNRRAHSSSGASSSRSSRRRLNGPSGSAGASTINAGEDEPALIARKEQEANDEAIAKVIAEQDNQQQQERARRQAAQKYKMHKA